MAKNKDFLFLLGRKIVQRRKSIALSQGKLAEKTGKIVNTISNIERGIGDPRISTLLDISIALEISLSQLVDVDMKISENYKKSNEKTINEIVKILQDMDEKTLKIAVGQIRVLKELRN